MATAINRLRQLSLLVRRCAQQEHVHCYSVSTQPPSIEVSPRVSLFDQKVSIKVQGLPSECKVTVHARTEQEWRRKPAVFASCGHYVTSGQGDLDLSRDASVGGTYTGTDPMGPFWSMRPSPSGAQNIRMVVRNGDDPILYTLSVYSGHLSLADLVSKETTLTPLFSTTVTRLKKAEDVRRVPVKEGNVRGTLFLPPGEGPHPGVIDMFGSAGGLMEIRASLLASHGFAVLALPFFRFDDLPASLEEVTFDYFEEAAEWLSSHRLVRDGGIGVVGVSTGAIFGLTMAWKCPQVKALVSINGPPFFWLTNLYRKDGTLVAKGIPLDNSKVVMTPEGVDCTQCFPHNTDNFIPVWESSAHFLCLVSEDDKQVSPADADSYYSLYPEDKRHLLEVVRFPGAGHLLEPPYSPYCQFCINPTFGVDFLWGGNPADHAAAQEDAWTRLLAFLHAHLP